MITTAGPPSSRFPLQRRFRAAMAGRWLLPVMIFVLAFAVRLGPVLRGGGLRGALYYDDGVYFGGSLALVHESLPYRDFLLLHPPGVLLAAAPFAALGLLTSDDTALALARLAWMITGSLTAALVSRVAGRAGTVAVVVAGVFLAVYYPQVRQDRSVMLEGVTSAVLIIGVLLALRALDRPAGGRRHLLLVAGLVLGLSPATKIWGVVVVLVLTVWVGVSARSRRSALTLLTGAVLSATAVCLPFLIAAPRAMWRMVVLDQLARPALRVGPLARFDAIGGLTLTSMPNRVVADVTVVVVLGVAVMITLGQRRHRWAPTLLVAMVALLLVTPSFFTYYPAALSVPLAVTLGAAAARCCAVVRTRVRSRTVVALGVLLSLVAAVGYAQPVVARRVGHRPPSAVIVAAAGSTPGCLTADEPITLIMLDVFGRNVDRNCRVVVDLGGYSYDLPRPVGTALPFPRSRDPLIQRYALSYLGTGTATIVTRFVAGGGYARPSLRVIARWPVVAASGRYRLRAVP